MRKIIMNCTVAALAVCSFAAPVLADSVIVTREGSYSDYHRRDHARPGITISDRGVSFGTVRDRHHRRDDGCVTKSVTRQTDEGSVTKTIKSCN